MPKPKPRPAAAAPKPDKQHLEIIAEIREVASALGYIPLAVLTGNETLEKILQALSKPPERSTKP
ncbi:MAG: hypothetical protein AAB654_00370 [Acidobacteriota bacterium]